MSIIIIIASLLFVFLLILYNSIATFKWHKNHLGSQYKAEAEHYYFYLIYYNPDDPRLFKPRGGGYTVNFARPSAIISTVIIIGGYLWLIFSKYN